LIIIYLLILNHITHNWIWWQYR